MMSKEKPHKALKTPLQKAFLYHFHVWHCLFHFDQTKIGEDVLFQFQITLVVHFQFGFQLFFWLLIRFLGGEKASHSYKTLAARDTKGWEGAIFESLAWLLFSGRAVRGRGQGGISCTVRKRGCWLWRGGAEMSGAVCADSRRLLVVGLTQSADGLDVGSRGQGQSRLAYGLLPLMQGGAHWEGRE